MLKATVCFGTTSAAANRTTASAACAWISAALAVLISAAFLLAQDRLDPSEVIARTSPYVPPPQYRLRTETRLVDVGVVVRDKRGRAVGGLRRNHFEIRDDGKTREIAAFTIQTFTPSGSSGEQSKAPEQAAQSAPPVRPRFVGLLFDDLNSNLAELGNSQLAAKRFVREGLAAGDQVAIFTTSSAQIIPFTAEVATLVSAIEGLKVGQKMIDSGSCPRITPYDAYLIAEKRDSPSLEVKVNEYIRCKGSGGSSFGGGNTPLGKLSRSDPNVFTVTQQATFIWLQVRRASQDALGTIRNIVDYMGKQPGSRLLLLASGGFLSGSLEGEQEDIITRALRGEVMVNSLDAKGLFTAAAIDMPPGGNTQSISHMQLLGTQAKDQANDALVYMAESTGGLFFNNNNDLDLGFRQLAMLPEVTYLLAFSPDSVPDGKFHKLGVRLTNADGRSVQARPGYFAVMDAPAPPVPERRLDREVLADTVMNEVPANLTARSGKVDGDKPGLIGVLHFDLKQMPRLFDSSNGIKHLTFIAALLDERGGFVTGREGVVDLALKGTTRMRLANDGINVRLQIEAPPGTYRLRFVIEDASEGKLTASIQAVSVDR
jgi:VWFA-related protein